MSRFPQRIWLAALLVAWAVDFLFWGKPAGVSFLIFVLAALAAGYLLAWFEKTRPALLSFLLSAAVIALATETLLRAEPLTRFINGALALAGLALLVRTFPTGGWIRYRILSYVAVWIDLFVAMLARAAALPLAPRSQEPGAFRASLRRIVPVLRGLLLALPVVVLLAALLSSADLIFADQLNAVLKNFDLVHLPEYLLRFFFILVMTYLFAGLYSQVAAPSGWVISLPGDKKFQPQAVPASEISASLDTSAAAVPTAGPSDPRFLGATEAFVVLGSVDILFAFFTAIQFRYLFGGRANITAAGYTFSEYTRRGFFELVSVAVICLLIYLTLNAVTRRKTTTMERVFTMLSVLLVGQVLVILVSAFQRLLMYETAYGFTRLRMYTHIFIPWLGFLLAATIVLQILRREQFFGALLLAVVVGFSLSFGALNIDGLIARQNVALARGGMSLDGAYLVNLSDDALPELVRSFEQSGQPGVVRDMLGGVLACRVYRTSLEPRQSWQSYHPGIAAARQSLVGVDLSGFQVHSGGDYRGMQVELDGGPFDCFPPTDFD
jgi:hypothetical protein